MFSAVAAYFFKIYLARILGAEALGIYALGMTVVGLAGVLAAGGLPQAANRFVAVYSATSQPVKLGRFLWSALAVLIVSNLLVGVAVLLARPWIAGPLYHTPALASYLHFFIPIMVTGSLTGFLGQALAGFKDVSVVVLLLLGWATWKLSPKLARRPSFGLPILEPEVVSFSVTFFGVQALTFLLSQSDKVLLGIYINPREVGIYSIAATLVAFVPLALQSVNQIFSPTIAELHARGDLELLARLFRSLIKWTLGLTIPLAAVMILFAQQIMAMFGPEFAPGWLVLVAGTFGQLVNCGVGSVGFLLLMSGQEKRVLKIQTVMAVVVVALNLALIPRMGLLGAALAGAAVNAATNLWSLAEVRKSLGIVPSARKYVALIAPTVIMIPIVLLFQRFVAMAWPAWAAILAGLTIGYLVFAAASLLALDSDDRVIARIIRTRVREVAGARKGV